MEDRKNDPKTTERNPNEALSTGAEEAHVEGNVDLDTYLADFGDASKHNKSLIQSLFRHGKPGDYVARTKTLIEKTAGILKK